MQGPLPFSDFRNLSESEIQRFSMDYKDWDTQSSKGHFFTVDLVYPECLHDAHSDLPVCVEKKTLTFNDFSPFTKRLLQKVGKVTDRSKENFTTDKLVADFKPKYSYTLHWLLLSLFLQLGLKVTKVHNIIGKSKT